MDYEACEAYRVALDHDEPLCASCGHLADDHDDHRSARRGGSVTRLPRRRRVAVPARKAS
jgi:hypothetical protein